MRWWALVLLCGCLVVGGTASAVPMIGMAMQPTQATTSMGPDCPDMAAAMPVVDDGAMPVDEKQPDCCRVGSCTCAAVYGAILMVMPLPLSRPAPLVTTVAAIGCSGYASPALPRFIRPPIS